GGIDADEEAGLVQGGDRILEMGEGRAGQAAEIDDIRTLIGELAGTRQNALDREMRGLDDLGEDADVVAAEIDAEALLAEMRRQIVEILGPALDRHTKLVRERGKIAGTMTGHDDA